ncbi:MAG: ribose transport system ATP-binding protein [Chloroflexota bacterium]|nr:ribose transport system ATP-binding protein [Chloroflexota bacterium]
MVDHSNTATTVEADGFLRLVGISKSFPGVKALNNVHLDVRRGEVHGLVGENGAGKSTLMKILSGAYVKDEGEIYWQGEKVEISKPKDSEELGIAIIYQEFNLVPQLSISENIWLGREHLANKTLQLIDWTEMHKRTKMLLDELNLDFDPKRPVAGLGVASQQMVEIAKALSLNAKLLIMDEPTSALSKNEVDQLFSVIRSLKEKGVSIIYISHHLDEVFEICDRGTVLRDGNYVATIDPKKTSKDELIQLMVGRTLDQQYPKVKAERGEELLRVEHLTREGVLKDISFSAYAGEVLGISGLVGSGRTELVKAIFGADPIDSGRIFVHGKEVRISSPQLAIEAGMGLLPEDRKYEGLVLILSVKENVSMASLDKLLKRGLLQLNIEKSKVMDFVGKLRILTPSIDKQVQNLSGGNQQKVVLAKWLASQSRILIFDEPTRGIDVGAKVEVYNLMNELVKDGVAVIMVSSEMPEVLGMSDRILVIHQGELASVLDSEEATQEKILSAAMGVK